MWVICNHCQRVMRSGEACPHCGVAHRGSSTASSARLAAGLLLMGLQLTGGGCAVSLYGVAVEDADGDGFFAPEDCDDGDPSVYPGAPEAEGADEDLDCDEDNDGSLTYEDCDDQDELIYPGAEEVPGDEVDSNCDGDDDT